MLREPSFNRLSNFSGAMLSAKQYWPGGAVRTVPAIVRIAVLFRFNYRFMPHPGIGTEEQKNRG